MLFCDINVMDLFVLLKVEELQKLNALREAPESRTIRNLEYASQSVDVR